MNSRLKNARNFLGLNQKELGERINLSQTHISSLENGSREMTDRIINDLVRELSLNESWLRTGEGEMFVESDSTIISELANEYKLDAIDQKIVELYIGLNEDERQKIKDHVVSLADQITSIRESAATIDENKDIEEELERTRLELEAEKKGRISPASDDTRDKSKGAG